MAAVATGGLVGKGRDISLAALQRHDPYINRIVDVASQVALYTFGHRANEWEKTDVEGTLFVYTRSASPKHGFTIMNRLSMENRTEPITKDLDFQLQDPFLLYRNARLSIYGIWFYDKEECQRIAELMKNLTQYEQLKAHQGAEAGISPMILNSGEGKEVDILRMLTKAKDEYTKTLDPELQHLSLTALFGKHDRARCQETGRPPQTLHQHQQQQEKPPVRQGVVRSLSYEEPKRHSPHNEKQFCPAIQKLLVRSADLHPLSELPENRPCENGSTHSAGEVFTGPDQSRSPQATGTSHCVHSASRTQNLFEKLHSAPGAGKCDPSAPAPASSAAPGFSSALTAAAPATQPQLVHFNGSLPPQALGRQAPGREQSACPRQMLPVSGNQTSGSGVISPHELLKKLQIVQQEQQLHVSHRPALAAKFPVVTQSSRPGNPLESWINKTSSTERQAPLFQVISPQPIPTTAAPSLLMSPMVFTHPTCNPTQRDSGLLPLGSQDPAAASASLLLPLQSSEPSMLTSSPLTKLQLQEALLSLIQNDDNFLNIIYEAYLFSMTQAATKKTF
ncbi:PREDICTED: mRNA-decapping enzyme 1B isoform X2 [Hipposideros armiger]|uniref:5'-(N(7)-methylguanosine 5'-triphospho)-[mRNA] hydrolase n=1 Tax=Hipposideros armiger TaxID=186990 RepID=A0A8B7S9T4_HIPAR|nr:PREDICTED: mRNA-decapping enzyme 1B isoform X2 [Hipposideros armiger]